MQKTDIGHSLSTRHVPSIVVSMTLARLPMGVVTLMLVLFVSIHYGATASGMATAVPPQASHASVPYSGGSRTKGARPLLPCKSLGVAELVAILGLVGGVMAEPSSSRCGLSFAAGALTPPIAGVTRSLWPVMLDIGLVSTALQFPKFLSWTRSMSWARCLPACSLPPEFPEWGLIAANDRLHRGSSFPLQAYPVKSHAARIENAPFPAKIQRRFLDRGCSPWR